MSVLGDAVLWDLRAIDYTKNASSNVGVVLVVIWYFLLSDWRISLFKGFSLLGMKAGEQLLFFSFFSLKRTRVSCKFLWNAPGRCLERRFPIIFVFCFFFILICHSVLSFVETISALFEKIQKDYPLKQNHRLSCCIFIVLSCS